MVATSVAELGGSTMFAPSVTATLADAFPPGGDVDGDGKADPGDTIRYTATIAVTGEAATGVNFSNPIDSYTSLVGGSISISPLAIAETYQSVGNMTLTTASIGADCAANALRSVTCNDALLGGTLSHFGLDTNNLIAVNGSNTRATTGGGTVLLNTDGTFVYDPAAGFEGTDTFIYRLTSGGTGVVQTNDATVSIVVGGVNGMAWFVTGAGGGTGRQIDPISIDALRVINNGTGSNPNDNDTIFLFEGTHALIDGLVLRTNQKLFGQDVNGVTLTDLGAPAAQPGNAWPALDAGGGTVSITSSEEAIFLGSNNEIAGFTVGNVLTAAITGDAVGALNVRDVVINTTGGGLHIFGSGAMTATAPYTGFTSITTAGGPLGVSLTGVTGTLALGDGAISGASGATFNVSGGSAAITYGGTITQNNAQRLISVSDTTGGSVSFTNASANALVGGASSTGILIDGAADSVTVNNADLTGTRGIEILGDAANNATGTYTFNNVTIGTAAGASNHAFLVDGDRVPADGDVSATIDLNNVDITNPGGQVAFIQGMSGGSIDFDSASAITRDDGGLGILIQENTGGTITFASATKKLNTGTHEAVALAANTGTTINFTGGGLDIDTTSGTAVMAFSGGTLTVTGANNNVDTDSSIALFLNSMTLGAAGMTFATVDKNAASGSNPAIQLVGVGTTGGGTLTVGSATVAGTSGSGISISTTSAAVTFTSVTIDNTGGNGIALTNNTGAISINGGTIGATNDPTGNTVDIDQGSGNVTIGAALTKNTAGRVVEVTGRTGGIVNVSGNVTCWAPCTGINAAGNTGGSSTIIFSGASKDLNTATNAAVTLDNNDAATIHFTNGGLNINTTSATGFNAINGAVAVNVTGSHNTIDSTTGTALTMSATTIGASGITFQSISADGASSGIVLSGTGSGPFSVTGDSSGLCGGAVITGSVGTIASVTGPDTADCTGGTIQNSTGPGVSLAGTGAVSLTRMRIINGGDDGITAGTVAGLTLTALDVDGNGDADEEHGMDLINITGTLALANSTIAGSYEHNVKLTMATLTLSTLTVSGSVFAHGSIPVTPAGGFGLLIAAETTSTIVSGTISDSVFRNNRLSGAFVFAQQSGRIGTGVNALTISNNSFDDNNNALQCVTIEGASLRCRVIDNTIINDSRTAAAGSNSTSDAIVLSTAMESFGGTFDARIDGNVIGSLPIARSGSAAESGIFALIQGEAASTITITNNTIHETPADVGIKIQSNGSMAGSPPTSDVVVTDNTVPLSISPSGVPAISVEANNSGIGGAATLRAQITGNVVPSGTATGATGAFLNVVEGTNILTLLDTGAASADATAELTSNNTGSAAATAGVSLYTGSINTVARLLRPNREPVPDRDRGQTPITIATTLVMHAAGPAPGAGLPAPDRDRGQTPITIASRKPVARKPASPVSLVATAARSPGSWRAQTASGLTSWAASHLRSALRTTVSLAARVPALLSATLEARSGETVNQSIGTIPAGRTVTIIFDVTVDSPRRTLYSTQGTVSGSNFDSVLTDDPAAGGFNPTMTSGDGFNTTTTLDAAPASPQFVSEAITLTATVTSEVGGGTPTGVLTFRESGIDVTGCIDVSLTPPSGPPNGTSVATCDRPGGTFTAGAKSFTAHYAGGSHDPSTSGALPYTYDGCTINPLVLNTNDIGADSLRDAVDNACPGATITFDLAGAGPHTIVLDSELTLTRNLTISGPADETVFISGGGANTILAVIGGSTVTLERLHLIDGFGSGEGGAVENFGELTFRYGSITNSTGLYGAAVCNEGIVTIEYSTISGNTATDPMDIGFGFAGGISNDGQLTIRHSTLYDNHAETTGGAIYTGVLSSTLVVNSTISGNIAGGGGGGFHNDINSTVVLIHSTVTENESGTTQGGGIFNTGALTLTNTIVAGNTDAADARDDINGAVDAGSSANLIGDGTNMTGIAHGSNNNLVGSSASPINPMLGLLANNGGPTQTHRLFDDSPALDAGISVVDPSTTLPIATDQRSEPRPADSPSIVNAAGGNGSDIGAFEAPAAPQTPDLPAADDTGSSQTDNITAETNPVFDIAGVTNGALVELLVDGTPATSSTAVGTTIQLGAGTLAEGPHAISARQTVAGVVSPPATALSITIDTTPPGTATIDLDPASDSGASNSDNVTNALTRVFNIGNMDAGVPVQLVRAGSAVDSTIGAPGTAQLSDTTSFTSGQIYDYVARQTDVAGNFSDSTAVNVTIDDTRADVTIASVAGDPTATSPIPVTVTFTKDITNFLAGDLVVVNGMVTNFSGSGAAFSFELLPTAEGEVTVDIAEHAAVDLAGNTSTAATQFSRTYDVSGPLAAITVSPDPRNSAVDSIDIVFDAAVTGVSVDDFTLILGGSNLLTGSENVTTSDGGITWTLDNLTGLTGAEGSYTLTLTAAGSGIADGASNLLTTDAAETWIMDTTAPAVTFNQAAGQADPASYTATVNFTVVFSEPINPATFTDTDIDLSIGTATSTTITITEIAPNDGTTFTVAFSDNTSGELIAIIPAGSVEDVAGNLNDASTSTDNTVTLLECTSPTQTVTSTDNDGPGTLRQALLDVCPGGTITFDLAGPGPHTITVTTGALFVDRDVTILGRTDERVILDGGGTSDLMFVFFDTTVRIERLTFANGYTPGEGAALFNIGTVSIYDSTFTSNVAESDGGAITNEGVMGLANSTISGNSANFGVGGGIFNCTDGLLFLLNTTITDNQAGDLGGGLYNITDVYMENTIVAGNTSVLDEGDLVDDAGGVTNDFGHNLIGGDPMLGPLQGNGGPTQTHAPLPGSPAIDAGDTAVVVPVPLAYDQRGVGFDRVRDGGDPGLDPAVDIGAVEAAPPAPANTPLISAASTLEDTPTTSGLVVTRNPLDGAEVTHFKITTLTGGTLFQHDGVTPIALGAFITAAEGNAGLVFLPAPHTFGLGTVGVRASHSAADAGLGGSEAVATVTITAVADTPSITNALTTVNQQTTSGLVITRNAVDGNEVTHYKITSVTGGTLFQANGTTPIASGDFITAAQGAAGLRFTPTTGSTATGQVSVRASVSNSDGGLGGSTVTADVVVIGAFTDDPLVAGVTVIKLSHLIELRARVNAQRVRFGLAAVTFPAKTAGVSMITALDVIELRLVLAQAYTAHGLIAPTYTDPALAAGMVIKAVHIQELRAAIVALEGS